MFVNLLKLKAYYHLSDDDMGSIIGVNRATFHQKFRTGHFWPNECRAYCRFFNQPFDYVFATEDDLFPAQPTNVDNSPTQQLVQ